MTVASEPPTDPSVVDVPAVAPQPEDAPRESEGSEHPVHASILQMKQRVQSASDDPAGTMSCLESVQDQLIDHLDSLNKRIENYIELLAAQRKSA